MNEIDEIKNRLFSVIPTSSLHMIEFLKLMNIRFTNKETNSAAVTCQNRPELLLNKDFINTYCQSDEHLFMLVMHELYHIILGHTHLFKKHTDIDNIAFDAVINAILCRMFPSEEYLSFFTSINSDKTFPSCILRPIGENTPNKFIPLLKTLYCSDAGTYYEVYECIAQEFESMLKNKNFHYMLLGNHSDDYDNPFNPILKKMVDDVISKWPKELIKDTNRLNDTLEDKKIDYLKAHPSQKKKMKKLLKDAGVLSNKVEKRSKSYTSINVSAVSVIPNYKDRTILSKSLIYGTPLIYNSTLSNNNIKRDNPIHTLVYLDVSGSVEQDIRKFAPLLFEPYQNKEILLFTFSTKVSSTTYREFKEGKYKTTGGTDINCVFQHYFSLPKNKQTKKILILTDGDTGQICDDYYQRLKKENIQIYCGLFGCYTKYDLKKNK